MKKVLVTGGAGYVGSTLVPVLLSRDYEVTVYDNLMYGGHGILPCFSSDHFHFIKEDVRDYDKLKEAMNHADIIVHLAAIVGYPACKKEPVMAKEVNEDASKFIADNLSSDQQLIFASTTSNYGAVSSGICTENTKLNPLTIYGKTKTAAEEYFLKKSKDNTVIFRFATAFGVSPRMRFDLMINDFVYQAVKNKFLLIYEKSFKRTFIHVKDMARAFVFAIENNRKMVNNVFNVGSESMNFNKEDVALLIKKYSDYYLHFAEVGKDEDQRNYEVSYKKISKLGYQTSVDIYQGLQELIKVMSIIEKPRVYSNV